MFSNYEELVCNKCEVTFSGRRPAAGGAILCPICLAAMETAAIDEGSSVPLEVIAEIERSREGDNK